MTNADLHAAAVRAVADADPNGPGGLRLQAVKNLRDTVGRERYGLRELVAAVDRAIAEQATTPQPVPSLVDALRAEFSETELHAFMVAAEHPNNWGASHWERLRRAAIQAANCDDCATTRR